MPNVRQFETILSKNKTMGDKFMKATKTTKQITFSAVLAALYTALTFLQGVLLPSSVTMDVQFRMSEALCVLAIYSAAAIPGLTLGCLLANLVTSATVMPLDLIFGTLATLAACSAMWALRKVRVFRLPIPSLLMPALMNGLIVGGELAVCFDLPFGITALCVAAGEAGVLLTLGTALCVLIDRRGKQFFRA